MFAKYLAKNIIDGKSYADVFSVNVYKKYQDEVDTILMEEGREDLIVRG